MIPKFFIKFNKNLFLLYINVEMQCQLILQCSAKSANNSPEIELDGVRAGWCHTKSGNENMNLYVNIRFHK